MDTEEILRKNVTRLREEKNWSIQELAEKLGIDRTYLSKSENGKRSFKVNEVEELARIFSVTTDYLLGRDGKEENSADTKDLQKFLEVNRKGMSFGDDPITDEQKEKLDIALKMIFEKYKDKR